MPRKLADHASAVTGLLRAADIGNWDIVPIDGMTEDQVAATLRRTRIFLSFSNLEGMGLPPVEAALAGNLVVGYTGQGGNEYWNAPLFTKIEQGNIQHFVDCTLETMSKFSGGGSDPITDPLHVAARADLANQFSSPAENETVMTFARKAASLLTSNPTTMPPVALFTQTELWRLKLELYRQKLEWFLVAGIKTVMSKLKLPSH